MEPKELRRQDELGSQVESTCKYTWQVQSGANGGKWLALKHVD